MEGIARTRRKGILSTLWSLEIWMRFIPVIDLLYGITRSVDLHIDDFSFRNTDAQFHPIDRKAIRAVASQPNVKTIAAFSQNICKSFPGQQPHLENGVLCESPFGRTFAFTPTSAISI